MYVSKIDIYLVVEDICNPSILSGLKMYANLITSFNVAMHYTYSDKRRKR